VKHPRIWVPINLGDWSIATQGLTHEECGILMAFIIELWERGEYPDERRTARILGIPWSRWQGMQASVGDALRTYLERSGLEEARAKAHQITETRRQAANHRWDKYRRDATQGLDAKASVLHMRNQKPESNTSTDRAEKPTRSNGLGNRGEGQGTWSDLRLSGALPNGKLKH